MLTGFGVTGAVAAVAALLIGSVSGEETSGWGPVGKVSPLPLSLSLPLSPSAATGRLQQKTINRIPTMARVAEAIVECTVINPALSSNVKMDLIKTIR